MKILQNILIGLSALYIALAPFAYFFLHISNELVAMIMLSGVLLAVLSRFPDVTELGLLGLKAKIERTISEAHATLAQVRALAKISSISSLANTARSGWFGGIPDEQHLEILRATERALRDLGFSPEEIKQATLDYHHCRLTEFRQTLLGGGASQIPSIKAAALDKVNEAGCRNEWQEFRSRSESTPVHPDELQQFFKKYGFLNDENQKRLNDYKHYYYHHEFLDFDDFKNRRNWPIMMTTGIPAGQ